MTALATALPLRPPVTASQWFSTSWMMRAKASVAIVR